MFVPPPLPPLFPYTTLFRSLGTDRFCDNSGSMKRRIDSIGIPDFTRRRLLQAAGGLFVLGAPNRMFGGGAAPGSPAVLSGTEFDLRIGFTPVNFTGRRRVATVVNGQLPAPLLRWREGDTVTLRVRNELNER